MISVELNKTNLQEEEMFIALALQKQVQDEVNELRCGHCNEDSKVIIKFNSNGFPSLQTQLTTCCPSFKKKVERILYGDAVPVRL